MEREAASQREVWYRLTPKGQALAPVIDALLVWGIDHALGRPRPGEAIHPGRAMGGITRYLERRGVHPARPVAWVVRFPDDRSYTIRFDGERWSRHRGEAEADVVVETSPEGWVRFLAADRAGRRRWLDRSRVKGTPKRVDELASAFGPGQSLEHMKLGTSVHFLFPTSPATHEQIGSLLPSMPKGAFIERPIGAYSPDEQACNLDEQACNLMEVASAVRAAGLDTRS